MLRRGFPDPLKAKINMSKAAANYGRCLAAMSKLTGLEPEKLINAEAGIILKTCVSRTKVASNKTVTQSARLRALRGIGATRGEVTVNAGVKGPLGRTWVKSETTGKYLMALDVDFNETGRHLRASEWVKVQSVVERAKADMNKGIMAAKASAALARQSWIIIADRLGIHLENVRGGGNVSGGAITKARSAKAKGNRQVNNGAAIRQNSPGKLIVTLINRLPYGSRLKFQAMIDSVMAGRAAFFATAVQKGFRGSVEQTAKLFPGWTVK